MHKSIPTSPFAGFIWLNLRAPCLLLAVCCCLATILSGCQLTPQQAAASDSQIDQWIKDKQFKQAILALEQRNPVPHQDIAKLTKQSEEASELEITHAKQLALKHHWKDAIEHLEHVIAQNPPNLRLSSMLASIRRQEKKVLREAEIRALVQRAQWLQAELKKNEVESNSSRSSWRTSLAALSLNNQCNTVFEDLSDYYRTMDQEHPLIPEMVHAMEVVAHTPKQINLVETLRPITRNPIEDDDNAAEESENKPINDNNKAVAQVESSTDLSTQQAERLSQQLNTLMERGSLIKARETLSQIQDLNASLSPPLKARLTAVESFLNEQASHLSAQGDELYRKGHFEQARTLWMLSARLNPLMEDTLAKIARSERVLKNLKDLRQHETPKELQSPAKPAG